MLSKERSERESTMMKAQIILVLYRDTFRIQNSILSLLNTLGFHALFRRLSCSWIKKRKMTQTSFPGHTARRCNPKLVHLRIGFFTSSFRRRRTRLQSAAVCSDCYARMRPRCAGSFCHAGKARLRNWDKNYRQWENNWSCKLKKHEPFKASFQMYCKFCAQNDRSKYNRPITVAMVVHKDSHHRLHLYLFQVNINIIAVFVVKISRKIIYKDGVYYS